MTDNQQLQDTKEHLPDCPLNGAYGCVGACPCWCHDEEQGPQDTTNRKLLEANQ